MRDKESLNQKEPWPLSFASRPFCSAKPAVVGRYLHFFLNKHFTFQNQSKGASVVIKFTINIVVCYLLAYGIARPAVRFLLEGSSLKVQENLSMLAGMVLFVGFNYIGQRFFAFAEREDRKKQ